VRLVPEAFSAALAVLLLAALLLEARLAELQPLAEHRPLAPLPAKQHLAELPAEPLAVCFLAAQPLEVPLAEHRLSAQLLVALLAELLAA
jgi:hypothetical protein